MTDLPVKPNPGSPAEPVILDSSMWSHLIDIVAAWRNGTLGGGETQTKGVLTTIMGFSPGVELQPGEVRQLDEVPDVVDAPQEIVDFVARKPLFKLLDPIWNLEMDKLVIANRGAPEEEPVPVGNSRYVVVRNGPNAGVLTRNNLHKYVQINPGEPTKLASSTSGPFKIIGRLDDPENTHILDTQAPQNLWIYELREDDPEDGGEVQATLLDLNGIVFLGAVIAIKSPIGQALGKEGDRGLCMQVSSDFIPIGSSLFNCEVLRDTLLEVDCTICDILCARCSPYATAAGDCECITGTRCLKDENDPGLNCRYTFDSITDLNASVASGHDYTQTAPSCFETESDEAVWTVPIDSQTGAETRAIVRYRPGFGWDAAIGLDTAVQVGDPGCGSPDIITFTTGSNTFSFEVVNASADCLRDCAAQSCGDPNSTTSLFMGNAATGDAPWCTGTEDPPCEASNGQMYSSTDDKTFWLMQVEYGIASGCGNTAPNGVCCFQALLASEASFPISDAQVIINLDNVDPVANPFTFSGNLGGVVIVGTGNVVLDEDRIRFPCFDTTVPANGGTISIVGGPCGNTPPATTSLFSSAAAPPAKSLPPIAVAFKKAHPSLFTAGGCSCNDAAAIMGQWGRGKSLQKSFTLARILHNGVQKNASPKIRALTRNELDTMIKTFLENYEE